MGLFNKTVRIDKPESKKFFNVKDSIEEINDEQEL